MASDVSAGAPESSAAHQETKRQDVDAWGQQNILTFDGGGVRGYFSLLILEKLMECIAIEEKEKDVQEAVEDDRNTAITGSFSPCGQPLHVSHVQLSGGQFLPCHYFDYIGGTSTGALITIMLARLRMPVHDCLKEYRSLAGQIFGHPRLFHQAQVLGVISRKNKYSTTNFEEAIKDVLRRRGEEVHDHDDAMLFSTPKGLCRAIVYATHSIVSKGPADFKEPWPLRSYDNYDKTDLRRHRPVPGTGLSGHVPPGLGTKLAIWKVARAATAAKLYFKPLEIAVDDGEEIRGDRRRTTTVTVHNGHAVTPIGNSRSTQHFTRQEYERTTVQLSDAGFENANNPSEAVLKEVNSIFRNRPNKKLSAWISIGTARGEGEAQSSRPRLLSLLKSAIHQAGNCEQVHNNMKGKAREKDFRYFRFNSPRALQDVEMDTWKPRGSGPGSGEKTIEKITNKFNTWANDERVMAEVRACAKALVENRRSRAKDTSRWERFALGRFYVCPEEDCEYDTDETWQYRDLYIRHLREDHRLEGHVIDERVKLSSDDWNYKDKDLFRS